MSVWELLLLFGPATVLVGIWAAQGFKDSIEEKTAYKKLERKIRGGK